MYQIINRINNESPVFVSNINHNGELVVGSEPMKFKTKKEALLFLQEKPNRKLFSSPQWKSHDFEVEKAF